jgi:hypothetical protein
MRAMDKKLLWTSDFVGKKLEIKQSEYDVTHDNQGITVTVNGNGWYHMGKEFYDRLYGDTALDVVSNRRKWLIEEILPDRIKDLTGVTDEIEAMTKWINHEGTL